MNEMYLLSCMTCSRVSQAPSLVRKFKLSFERSIEVTGKLETFHHKVRTNLRRQRSLKNFPTHREHFRIFVEGSEAPERMCARKNWEVS